MIMFILCLLVAQEQPDKANNMVSHPRNNTINTGKSEKNSALNDLLKAAREKVKKQEIPVLNKASGRKLLKHIKELQYDSVQIGFMFHKYKSCVVSRYLYDSVSSTEFYESLARSSTYSIKVLTSNYTNNVILNKINKIERLLKQLSLLAINKPNIKIILYCRLNSSKDIVDIDYKDWELNIEAHSIDFFWVNKGELEYSDVIHNLNYLIKRSYKNHRDSQDIPHE